MISNLTDSRKIDNVCFTLTLVRHAETDANADGIIQGLIDTELSDIGYRQSKALGQRMQDHHFSHIYSSDLKRASNTARQILLLNRVSSCRIKYDSLLRERMYGVAQGRTRQWFRELAKKSGIHYTEFTPSGAETTAQVRERAVKFFRKLCQELLIKSCTCNLVAKTDRERLSSRSISTGSLSLNEYVIRTAKYNRSISLENVRADLTNHITVPKSCQSSVDSALDLSYFASNQQSILSSSSSTLSDNSNTEQQQTLENGFKYSQCNNECTKLNVLVVSHGGVIRELIKHFVYDLKTHIGQHFESIQAIAPNTSMTRFQVTYITNEQFIPKVVLELIDYHNKAHLINTNINGYNLDRENRCSL